MKRLATKPCRLRNQSLILETRNFATFFKRNDATACHALKVVCGELSDAAVFWQHLLWRGLRRWLWGNTRNNLFTNLGLLWVHGLRLLTSNGLLFDVGDGRDQRHGSRVVLVRLGVLLEVWQAHCGQRIHQRRVLVAARSSPNTLKELIQHVFSLRHIVDSQLSQTSWALVFFDLAALLDTLGQPVSTCCGSTETGHLRQH